MSTYLMKSLRHSQYLNRVEPLDHYSGPVLSCPEIFHLASLRLGPLYLKAGKSLQCLRKETVYLPYA